MLDRIKSKAYGILTSERGDRFAPIRAAKMAALKANDAAGRPLAPADEIAERRAYESGGQVTEPTAPSETAEPAPVIVFHLDKHHQKVKKIADLLGSAGIPHELQNIEGDEPAIEATLRDAGGFALPVVFIGGDCVGGLNQLIDLNNNDQLRPLVWGR